MNIVSITCRRGSAARAKTAGSARDRIAASCLLGLKTPVKKSCHDGGCGGGRLEEASETTPRGYSQQVVVVAVPVGGG